ncbi:MAG: hypothetical protein AAGJ46_06240 [Planctomycetota bacterium]
MSRSSKKPSGSPVSLFPFLAVLLCTMGALVILLVAMSHAARNRTPEAPTEAAVAEDAPETEIISEEEQQQREAILAKAKTAEEEFRARAEAVDKVLREDQLRLSQLEDHMRRMLSEVEAKRAAIAQLLADETEKLDDRAQAERNLEQLKELIEEAKQEIAEIKEENAGKEKAYAIVPYRGRSGTRRRPIYIECLEDRVVLQPEGVELMDSDFVEPLGVGNPLASALRATREHYARENPDAGYDPDAEPYPLIIVRPKGIKLYYRVREAIRSWDSDFGYELVSEDTELDFSMPSATLSHAQTSAVKHSRMRRQLLARAAPRAYQSSAFNAGRGQRGGGGGEPYDGRTLDGTTGSRGEGDPGSFGIDGSDDGQFFAASGPQSSGGNGEGEPGFGGDANNPGPNKPGLYQPPSDDASEDAYGSGNASDQQLASSQSSAATSATAGGPPSGSASAASQSQSGSQSPGGNASESASMGSSVSSFAAGSSSRDSSRQGDWALEDRSPSDIAIRRTVGVVVDAHQLVVMSQEGAPTPGRQPRGEVIKLDGSTDAGVAPFVGAMQRRIRSWGMAGQGLYWRPVVRLHVSPNGARRADELVRLLRGSGIDIQQQRTATREQPTVLPATGGSRATR